LEEAANGWQLLGAIQIIRDICSTKHRVIVLDFNEKVRLERVRLWLKKDFLSKFISQFFAYNMHVNQYVKKNKMGEGFSILSKLSRIF